VIGYLSRGRRRVLHPRHRRDLRAHAGGR
jgi:hypothetical protein